MVKEIPLTRGMVALVDDEDHDLVTAFKWHTMVATCGHRWYAVRSWRSPRPGTEYMHRMLLAAERGLDVDHINGNGLDNRRVNLRLATRRQNNWNQRSFVGTSRYKGVHWATRDFVWTAHIKYDGRNRHLGNFKVEEEAAMAYDAAAKIHFGEFARLNFGATGG
jgi:hypothetical protein